MKRKRNRFLICFAVLIALLIPIGGVLAANFNDFRFESLFQNTYGSNKYSAYRIEIEKTRLYTVAYMPNYDDADEESVADSGILAGSNYAIKPSMFTRDGFDFSGWNTKADGTGDSYIASQMITLNDEIAPDGNLTLFAQWTPSEAPPTSTPEPEPGKIIVLHISLVTGQELAKIEEYIVGEYAYLPQRFPGYGNGILAPGSDPASGTIAAGETKTIIFYYFGIAV